MPEEIIEMTMWAVRMLRTNLGEIPTNETVRALLDRYCIHYSQEQVDSALAEIKRRGFLWDVQLPGVPSGVVSVRRG